MTLSAKVRLASFFFLVAFFLVACRLVYWQVFMAEGLASQAEWQHFNTLFIPARRGEILTSDGFPLVADKNDYLFYVNLTKFSTSTSAAAEKIADVLSVEVPLVSTSSADEFYKRQKLELEASIAARLRTSDAVWVNLAHFVSRGAKEKIESLNIPGLGFADEQSRDYPEASMAAQILGFVGFDSVGNPKGYFGIEGKYDRELAGKPGEIRVEKDALGRPIAIGEETRRDKQDGRDLVLTIDRAVQKFTEKRLSDGISDWKASGGTAIVMDPNSGAIKALASFPSFDPKNFPYYSTDLYKNPAVSDLYEPGSIIKPLVMAAAINENKLTPETRCDECSGPKKIGGYYVHTFNNQYHPDQTMTEVLINSDNTGMIFVGEKLGFESFYSYMRRFGFGKKSGLDILEEEEGALRPVDDYYSIDKATMTFGQGISVNAIQMVRAWSSLANGGFLVTPHFVDKIKTTTGDISLSWPKSEQVISRSTAKTLTEMLVRVANESPEHFPKDQIRELDKFRIAAKSGTAQIALGGKYREQGTVASVIGFFPADNPKFLVMVKLNEPEVRPWGSDTAGPVFFGIVKDLIAYYGLAP